MAVTRREYNIAAFWNSNDVLDVLETALADVGYHAPTQTGSILTFTNTSGTTLANERSKRYLVKQSATSGSGVNAVFEVLRNSATGAVSTVTLVRGGKNYSASNTITIAGADIGGTTPTDNITVTVSTVSGAQGSTTTWFDKDTATPYTWGVCCVNNNESKKLGQTYYSFHISGNPTINPVLSIKSGTGFQSTTNVFLGVSGYDFLNNAPTNSSVIFSQTFSRTNTTPIRLVTFQSGIDSNFVVFQFSDVEKYGDVFRDPFFLSKYDTATQPWDLDDFFTGAIYTIGKVPISNTADSNVHITTQLYMPRRTGEFGYAGYPVGGTGSRTVIGYYESIFGRRMLTGSTAITTLYPTIYQRSLNDLNQVNAPDVNPVITGLPICNTYIPVPYYIPADFGITEVIGTNTIAHRDIITTGSTTQWRVLQYANNLNAVTYNSSIAFVCKVQD